MRSILPLARLDKRAWDRLVNEAIARVGHAQSGHPG